MAEIANRRGIAMSTARAHVRGVLYKLDVHSQLAAVLLAYRVGWRPADVDC